MDPAAGDGAPRYVYDLRAGQVAFHRALTPHGSFANTSRRWRRVLTFNYIIAEAAELGAMNYADFADGSAFPKECECSIRLPSARGLGLTHRVVLAGRADFLVAGHDPHSRGFRRSPFEEGAGYTGAPGVKRPGHLWPAPRLAPGARL